MDHYNKFYFADIKNWVHIIAMAINMYSRHVMAVEFHFIKNHLHMVRFTKMNLLENYDSE